MQNKKFSAKLISLLLLVSCLVSLFSVFAFATTDEADETTENLNVVLNRDFDEGWDYSNGFKDAFAGSNKVAIKYELTDSGYNHYLRFEKVDTGVSYVYVDTSSLDKSGKTYVEFDLASSLNNTMGQAVRVSVQGNLKTLVEFKDDGMYILGENVGHPDYAMKWESVAFEFDFDYSENNADAQATAYKVTAYYNNAIVATAVYNCGFGGFGVSQLRFAFGNVLDSNKEQWYAIDNVRVYSGADEFTVLSDKEYGSAVNSSATRDFPLATLATGQDGFLYGKPDLEREDNPHGIVNHYNRHYGEGWQYNNYYTGVDRIPVNAGANEYSIKKEKVGDANNWFLRFRALADQASGLNIPIVEAPDYGRLVIEFDIKAGVNVHLGDIIQVQGSTSQYIVAIENGQLVLFGKEVGYIGNDWVKVVIAFDYESEDDGKTYCTVHYGSQGYLKVPFTYTNIDTFVIGMKGGAGDECYGDWYAIDNLQIYSGVPGYATLNPNQYGKGVYSAAQKDFDLNAQITPDAPLEPEMPDVGADDRDNVLTNGYISGSPNLERIDYDTAMWLQYHRTYSEGWSFGVGGGNPAGIITSIENEQRLDLSYNYFQRYEGSVSGNKYWTLTASGQAPKKGKAYLELDVRAIDGADFGGVIQVRTTSGASGSQNYLVGFEDGYLVVWDVKVGKISEDQWVHIAFEFDYDYASTTPDANPNSFKLRAYIGDEWYLEKVITGKTATTNFGIQGFRIGFESCPSACFGQYWDMDNLAFYSADSFVNIPENEYGNLIPPSTPKDFPIQSSSISLKQMINESLFMKVGCDYSLVDGTRQPVLSNAETGAAYGAPKKIDETVWIPLDAILNFLNYPIYIHEDGQSFDISTGSSITYITLGRDTASVAGTKVQLSAAPCVIAGENEYLAIAAADVGILFPDFGFVVDDMNLIIFTKHKSIVDNPLDQDTRIGIMTDFIFEFLTGDEIHERAEEYTNNFDHPYIYANQEKFDELHRVWLIGQQDANDGIDGNTASYNYDYTLYTYINRIVNSARGSYNKYSSAQMTKPADASEERYAGLVPEAYVYDNESHSKGLQHSYKESAGYDPIGGRLYPPYDPLINFAYAYQVTRDERFSFIAFDYAECLAHWDHWGPGHFLNCADTAGPMGVTYDWCYDSWIENGLDTDVIADGIYYHGVLQGYLVSIGKPDPHGRAGGNGSNYTTMVNNWNPVCTNGVATGAFAVMDYTEGLRDTTKVVAARHRVSEYGNEKTVYVCQSVVSMNFKTLISNGLDIYAPDGSYEESVSYWAYGAGNLFAYSALLDSVFGYDLGIMDTWGIDRTCRSILHMVSSDDVVFAYNDGSVGGSFTSSYFNYVAHALDDDFLRIIRRDQIKKFSKGASMWDTFYYVNPDTLGDVELELQYHHIGIHGYTMRSSWERGAIFAGMLGGDNDDGHGHIDAGQWIYYNKGISWIEDIGPDGYNTYNYFSNNHMYKTTVEGHNCILLTSLQDSVPAGQLRNSVSPVISTGANEYGSFATFDMKPAYGTKAFDTITRGIFLTNDRNTVIIQDEIVPLGTQSFYWLAHYNNKTVTSVKISESGRAVYMTAMNKNKEEYTLRIQMVSTIRRGITFEKMTSYDFLLDATMRPGDSEAHGKQPEGDRSQWSKLAVKFQDLTFYEFAVAIEIIDPDNPIDVGYTFTKMGAWEPGPDTRVQSGGGAIEEEGTEVAIRTTVSSSEVPQNLSRLNGFFNNGTLFTTDISRFYRTITSMTFAVNKYGRDTKVNLSEKADASGTKRPAIEIYDEYYEMYDNYFVAVDTIASQITAITTAVIGG